MHKKRSVPLLPVRRSTPGLAIPTGVQEEIDEVVARFGKGWSVRATYMENLQLVEEGSERMEVIGTISIKLQKM